jgi:hypothetical protein
VKIVKDETESLSRAVGLRGLNFSKEFSIENFNFSRF